MEATHNINGGVNNRRTPVINGPTNPMVTPLLTDLYQFTMAYAYWKAGKHNDRAVLVYQFLVLIVFDVICVCYSCSNAFYVFN